MTPPRLFVAWCPDWPVVAAGAAAAIPPDEPAAVFLANRVVASSGTARAEGIRRGLRRREAQARCPELVVFEDDPARDARYFEPVALAVEGMAPGVEIVRPGVLAVLARGPAGYFGGEAAAAERLLDTVAAETGLECQLGAADGLFAATLAARRGLLVPPGKSAEFLAPLSIRELELPVESTGPGRSELVDLVRRLGIRTMGGFADLPARDVASRFGAAGEFAHRLCRGLDERPPSRRRLPPELAVTERFDPPVDRVDAAAFAARALATRLHDNLIAHGFACSRLLILARTEDGGELSRTWRCAEPLTPAGTADRVRWQLDGWLTGRRGPRPTSGITELRVEPDEVIAADALQLDLLGGDARAVAKAERAGRAMLHVQGLLGPEAVLIGVRGGGRGPADQLRLVPWGDERTPALLPEPPWPGRLPAPAPTSIPPKPVPAKVFDATGHLVAVTDRSVPTAPPHRVAVRGGTPRTVRSWAGPWPVDERWWSELLAGRDTSSGGYSGRAGFEYGARRVSRFQVVLEPVDDTGEVAVLLAVDGSDWWVEGVYG